MITLLLPTLIWYFGGTFGRWYVLAGVFSLTLDWLVFYLPGFAKDREFLSSLFPNHVTQKDQEHLDGIMSYTKWQIFHVQWQSLGWWVFTSWRWLKFFDKDYRSMVGAMFVMAAIDDPCRTPKDFVKAMKKVLRETP